MVGANELIHKSVAMRTFSLLAPPKAECSEVVLSEPCCGSIGLTSNPT